MSNSESSDMRNKAVADRELRSDDSLKRLREMLLEPFQVQLDQLQERLDNPEVHAKEVSRVLPEAIRLRSSQDKKMVTVLEPITEEAIKASIKKNRQIFVDVLFPVMGPAIRKAIAAAIRAMVQNFNQILEYSLSKQGLKWRFEALRTRKPLAEVILLHTLVYQVEQVFLIHKDTGLELHHVVSKSAVAQDPDLISGMLTAIKDFVQDSFGASKHEALETMRVGERSIWIEHGRQAILAAVIQGNPPMELQSVLRESLDDIHLKKTDQLASFDGDTASFEEIGYVLDNCLQAQYGTPKQKKPFLQWIILAAIIFGIGIGSFYLYRDHRQWKNYFANLRRQAGIVITHVDKESGKFYIKGLRDPLAADPEKLLKESGLDPGQVVFRWEPYHSFYPQYALPRINDITKPPGTISFELSGDTLYVRGSALHQWLVETRKLIKAIPWILNYADTDAVDINLRLRPPDTVELQIKENVLFAQGTASHQWIVDTREAVKAIPGVADYREHKLVDRDQEALDRAQKRLLTQSVLFEAGRNQIAPGQEKIVNDLIDEFQTIFSLAKLLGRQYRIEIIGHADSSRDAETNLQISAQRAEAFLTLLVAHGAAPENFSTRGVGAKEPLPEEISEQDRTFDRRITFKVVSPSQQP
jgi:OOP family OmpA-OmpF porin